jgi:hypothetical protein
MQEYLTIQQQHYQDALKYLERAKSYAEAKQFVHCTGCLRKASRKLELATFWDMGHLDEITKQMIDVLSKNVANSILNPLDKS